MPHRLIVVSFLLIFSLFGCVKYKKAPLVPSEVLQEIEVIRNKDEKFANNSLTFDLVAKVMSENSLQLKLIRTKYESVCKVAKIKTPWFNPSIEFGPDFGTSLASQVSNKVAPFVGLGFTIPLGGKLKKNNNLNSAKALRALLEVQAQHRELYLSLRETYTLFYLALKKKKINQEVTVGSQLTLKIVKSLANVGSVDILEVGLTELEVSKMSLKNLEIQQDIEKLRSELIIIIGFDIKSLSQESQVVLPTPEEIKLPVKDEIKLILVENHLGLARLRLDYEVAEKELCLEISKQYPNIQLGGDRSGEVGESKVVWGLRIGVTVPVFDRNQQGIALALGKREEIRQEYMAVMHKALAELDKDFENVNLSFKKYEILSKVISPASQSNLLLADNMLKTGNIDIFKYLSILHSHQANIEMAVNLEADLRIALLQLEKNLGRPILFYPGEQEFNLPLECEYLDNSENSNEK